MLPTHLVVSSVVDGLLCLCCPPQTVVGGHCNHSRNGAAANEGANLFKASVQTLIHCHL